MCKAACRLNSHPEFVHCVRHSHESDALLLQRILESQVPRSQNNTDNSERQCPMVLWPDNVQSNADLNSMTEAVPQSALQGPGPSIFCGFRSEGLKDEEYRANTRR